MTTKYLNITLLLLPNQLFSTEILAKLLAPYTNNLQKCKVNIIMLEHPVYFGMRKPYGQMRFNKLKLLYQMATTRYYIEEAISNSKSLPFILGNVTYITNKEKWYPHLVKQIKANKCEALFYFDPVDVLISKEYVFMTAKMDAHHPCIELSNPGFINTKTDLAEYHATKKNAESFFHAGFYQYQRTKLVDSISLTGTKTYDTENRNKMPLTVTVPELPEHDNTNPAVKRILQNVSNQIAKHRVWSSFPGSCEPNMLKFPITPETSAKWLTHFCRDKLNNFGKYQDAIDGQGRNFLFHSCISPMLNTGLLTPMQVITTVRDYYVAHKAAIPIAAYEGFIRQVIGWREYQRYIYIYAGDKMRNSNIFNNGAKLSEAWYTGTTGIQPVDDGIIMAFRDGYLHHILRLMVMGNIMNLVGIHPHDVYKWFMEFSLDSYDWVMIGNVYSMALWADGGLTMRKPYFSSSAYILKMSTYKKGAWCETWDNLFHGFIDRNSDQLSKTYYAGLVRAWKKKSMSHKSNVTTNVKHVIDQLTHS
jgi:deoxyribodipyrimidine photolyase-related protein